MTHYAGVQSLRGIGALMVVIIHINIAVQYRIDAEAWRFTAGAAGVDLFFMISGFIMLVTTAQVWGKAGQALPFLKRRLIRIVPLYWVATSLKLAILLLAPGVMLHSNFNWWHTIASYLFIPALNKDGLPHPLVTVGWTLSFEMFFYLLFAGVLALRAKPLPLLAIVLTVLSILGLVLPSSGYAVQSLINPLLFEFVVGMWIGWLALEKNYGRVWKAKIMQHIGDASYAIYLFHGFVVPPVGIILAKFHLGTVASSWVALLIGIPVAVVSGIVIHYLIERPMTRYLKAKL